MAGESEIPESASVTTNLILKTPLAARPMSKEELVDSYPLEFVGVDLLVLQKVLREAIEKAAENIEEGIDLFFHSCNALVNLLFQVSDLKPDLINSEEFEKLVATVLVGLLGRYKGALEQDSQWEVEMAKGSIEALLDRLQDCPSVSNRFKTELTKQVESELI